MSRRDNYTGEKAVGVFGLAGTITGYFAWGLGAATSAAIVIPTAAVVAGIYLLGARSDNPPDNPHTSYNVGANRHVQLFHAPDGRVVANDARGDISQGNVDQDDASRNGFRWS